MATETTGEIHPPVKQLSQPALLQRPLLRLNLEITAYLALIIASIVAHLWQLDMMAMHHDESIHAWASWNFYMGKGGSDCAWGGKSPTYCYNPIYHGPSLYIFTLISYFLFGDGDAQARLPMAAAGVAMVASAWMFRPLIGRRGAFIAAVLLAFSPSLLYFTRFARHDGLMVLWEVWMVASVFRYLQSGRDGWLYLLAASLALAVATHELYYILFFIFGIFVLVRLLAESRFAQYLNIGLLATILLCVVLIILNPPLPLGKGLYLGEKAFLVGISLLMAWLAQHVWPRQPLLTTRLAELVQDKRKSLFIAIGIFLSIYVVMYTTFLTNPTGITGIYDGIAYWLGSQHEYKRGDQPWYYYLMQLPLYHPLGVLCGIGTFFALFARKRKPHESTQPAFEQAGASASSSSEAPQEGHTDFPPHAARSRTNPHRDNPHSSEPGETPPPFWRRVFGGGSDTWFGLPEQQMNLSPAVVVTELVPLLLLFWYVNAIVIFSWAGEKMPWLLVHMSLPGCLLAAWVLGRLFATFDPPAAPSERTEHPEHADSSENQEENQQEKQEKQEKREAPPRSLLWMVPPAFLLMLVAFGVAVWRFWTSGGGQEGQSHLLQGLVPLIIGGAMLYGLLTLLMRLGWRVLLAAIALTLAAVLGAYMLRSAWLAVYDHPDTPIELLVYTQTSPDIPYLVDDMEELSINLARNYRSEEDVTGSFSMPMIIDGGDAEGEGSLAWPLQWYFRHFHNITWMKTSSLEDPGPTTLEVTFPDESKGLAPVVMLYKMGDSSDPRNNSKIRTMLEENYVMPYGKENFLNWWFPEGNKCQPEEPGYKRFYYNTWTPVEELTQPGPKGCERDISASLAPPWAPLIWPFLPESWDTLRDFVLFRKLPPELNPGAREMEVWVRSDLAGLSGVPTTRGPSLIPLEANQSYGNASELSQPTGITLDRRGRVYVADTMNHRIQIYARNGELEQTIGGGGPGRGEGKFHEPRGIAVDEQGNIYVADTWNARIVKLDPDGNWLKTWGSGNQDLGGGRMVTITGGSQEANANNPLGFFGPRALVIDEAGNIYIADTGNRRIVVTDNEGDYLYQWGYEGSGPGQFNEPTGLAIDSGGNVYVADSWNSRVQVFPMDANGRVAPAPIVQWNIGGWASNTYDDPNIGVDPKSEMVFVSVPRRNSVLAANMRGDILFRWGGSGDDMASLNAPSGITVGADQKVYVVDRASNRVLRFDVPQVRMTGGE
jgi:uncharacterized protein (TIGR03663 family)